MAQPTTRKRPAAQAAHAVSCVNCFPSSWIDQPSFRRNLLTPMFFNSLSSPAAMVQQAMTNAAIRSGCIRWGAAKERSRHLALDTLIGWIWSIRPGL